MLVAGAAPSPGTAGASARPVGGAARLATQSNLVAVSCPAASSCNAVGYFLGSGGEHTFTQMFHGHGWRVVSSPSPSQADELTGVSCRSAGWCVSVGTAGVAGKTVAELFSGRAWRVLATVNPAEDSGLVDVSCVSKRWCVAVGAITSHPRALVELFNGRSWSVMAAPSPPGATLVGANSVSCASVSFCMMVGYYSVGRANHALAEVFDGTSWTVTSVPARGRQPFLNGASCPAPGRCVAVGSSDVQSAASGALADSFANGEWSAMPDAPAATHALLNGVSCPSVGSCVAVGARRGQAFAERLGAGRWSVLRAVSPGDAPDLEGVSCQSSRSCMAVGQYEGGGAQASTLAERLAGKRWSLLQTPDKTV